MKRKVAHLSGRERRHKRIRYKIQGTGECPRLNVFRSDKHIYSQLIDDVTGITLISASTLEMKAGKKSRTKTEAAAETGKLLAQRALQSNITQVVFDRGGYKYHGRVAAIAAGAREAGLVF